MPKISYFCRNYKKYNMTLKKAFLCLALSLGLINLSAANMGEALNNSVSAISMMNGDNITHTILHGETVYSIAIAYGTTTEDIYKLNPDARKGIKVGGTLQIPIAGNKATTNKIHKVEAKQTLYGISQQYGISVDDIIQANPGLTSETFQVGRDINIPVYSMRGNTPPSLNAGVVEHKVNKGETLYSISKQYDVSIDALYKNNSELEKEGLKVGRTILVPSKTNSYHAAQPQYQQIGAQEQVFVQPSVSNLPDGVFKIGILLPFLDKNSSIQNDKIAEYYQGFLLALKDMKVKGLSIEVYTFDIGDSYDTKRLRNILETTEMSQLSFILGGVSDSQIEVLSDFSQRTGVKYIIPFGAKSSSNKQRNASVFELTSSHSLLFGEVIKEFKTRFSDCNIVFVKEDGIAEDKADFVGALKTELRNSGVSFREVSGSSDMIKDITSGLDIAKKNIFIPTSSTEGVLRKLLNAAQANPSANISFFGYPEWQTYTPLYSQLHKYDSYLYSIFFLDDKQWKVGNVTNEYKTWYNKNIINSYPKYAFLGYDTGLYFLTALQSYGNNFQNSIYSLKVPTLQSAISFGRDNVMGGYVNKGIYLIHFAADSSIEKIECEL